MRILLLSAYDADSHKAWREGLEAEFSEHEWCVLSLPPRYFSWRIRGNSLTWAFEQRALLEAPYDLLIATSMVDLSSLRGFVPKLADIPSLLYFHENQFAFPQSAGQHQSIEPQVVSLYSALCADKIAFNSAFNRDSFFQGAEQLLKRLPDAVPKGLVETLRAKSSILSVPIDAQELALSPEFTAPDIDDRWPEAEPLPGRPLRILWAARWEYDKGPEGLLAILRGLESQSGFEFELCLLGQSFRQQPEAFGVIQEEFGHRLVQMGYETSLQRYQLWQRRADVVLSTAIHEFQGLAVLEAINANCIPVLPARLVYKELVPSSYLYESDPQAPEREGASAVELLLAIAEGGWAVPDVSRFCWPQQKPIWASVLQNV